MNTNHDALREEFEKFVRENLGDVPVMDVGKYISPKIHNYWLVWQAALSQPMPEAAALKDLLDTFHQGRAIPVDEASAGYVNSVIKNGEEAISQPMPEAAAQGMSQLLGKYGDVLRPFVVLMDKELHANAGKGDRPGWLEMSPQQSLLEIYYHVAKLQKAIKNNDGPSIQEHAADVANMAMMALDVCGGLALMGLESAASPAAPEGANPEQCQECAIQPCATCPDVAAHPPHPQPQAQGEPEDDLVGTLRSVKFGTHKNMALHIAINKAADALQSHREALAQRRAALEKCVEALKLAMHWAGPVMERDMRSPSNSQWMVEKTQAQEDSIYAAITHANQVLEGGGK